jgi:hypothetical protein
VPLLLESAGLELACRYGDFDGGPLTSESANQICLARSRVDAREVRHLSLAGAAPAGQ